MGRKPTPGVVLVDPCPEGHNEWRLQRDGWRCLACNRLRSKRWADRHREEINAQHRAERYHVKSDLRRYGLTPQDKEQMWWLQYQCCGACFKPIPLFGRGSGVDHDHATGKVRALLCTQCNAALGHVKDDPETLMDLRRYLVAHG